MYSTNADSLVKSVHSPEHQRCGEDRLMVLTWQDNESKIVFLIFINISIQLLCNFTSENLKPTISWN